jgi:hypothetical protein
MVENIVIAFDQPGYGAIFTEEVAADITSLNTEEALIVDGESTLQDI